MAKFIMQPLVGDFTPFTVRLGSAATLSGNMLDTEQGKPVKLVGESRYDLCVEGDAMEAFIVALQGATIDGYTLGSVQSTGLTNVTANGLQATGGSGTINVGDVVVAGTNTKGTAATNGAPNVVKATSQTPGPFAWRVVSLGTVGTGAVGTVVTIARLAAY